MSIKSPIPPTIGRIVLLNLNAIERPSGPVVCPGIVTEVHNNNCINVTAFPSNAQPFCMSSVPYNDDLSDHSGGSTFHWMDYQRKVAETTNPVTGEAK